MIDRRSVVLGLAAVPFAARAVLTESADIDLYVILPRPENLPYHLARLRYGPGDVVDWLPAGSHPGTMIRAPHPWWRILRVRGLRTTEAITLCSHGPRTPEDERIGVLPRRRIWRLPLDMLPAARPGGDLDLEIDRADLLARVILKPEEPRDPFTGLPVLLT